MPQPLLHSALALQLEEYFLPLQKEEFSRSVPLPQSTDRPHKLLRCGHLSRMRRQEDKPVCLLHAHADRCD